MKPRLRGQAMSEYLILTALISIASIAVVQVLGTNLRARLAEVSEHLRGHHSAKIQGTKATQEHYKIRDLGDFGDAAQDNGEQ